MPVNFIQTLYYGFKNWKTSIVCLVVVLLGSSALFVKNMRYTYHADAKILPIESSPIVLSDTISSAFPALEASLRSQDHDHEQQIIKILNSRTFIENVGQKVNSPSTNLSDEKLSNLLTKSLFLVQKEMKSGVIVLSMKFSNPAFAQKFLEQAITDLTERLKIDTTGNKDGQMKLFQDYIQQTQTSIIQIETTLRDPKSDKKALTEKISILRQINTYLNQQYELLNLESSHQNDVQFFSIVDKSKASSIPDAPDKKLLLLTCFILTIFVTVGYIYARLYIKQSLQGLNTL